MGGCDMMVCGMDAHGGNRQNGCGAHFMWSQARPYKTDGAVPAELGESAVLGDRPERSAEQTLELCQGVELPCSYCSAPITGVGFRCIHCRGSLALCLQCLPVHQDALPLHAMRVLR